MSLPISLEVARQRLGEAVADFPISIPDPLNVSPWIAMSALQKAIRRGRGEIALRAAATLLLHSPERLWRRCGGIVYEDIGVADLETVSLVTAALAGKKFRATLGGEWQVTNYIVSRMARAVKCRAADDLLMSVELHPAYELARRTFGFKTTSDLLDIATGSEPLALKALALWYAIGTERRTSGNLRPRRGEPSAVFDALREAGISPTLVEIAHEGFRKVGEVLCPFVVLLDPVRHMESGFVEDDVVPPEIMIGEVPSWAYDMFTREGREALRVFLLGSSDTARWVQGHVPPPQQVNFLGRLVFCLEGGLVRQRLRWPTADELRRLVEIECQGPGCPDATKVLQLMRNDIGQLNDVRGHVC